MKEMFTVKRVLVFALCLIFAVGICITPYVQGAELQQTGTLDPVKLTFLVDNNTKPGYYFRSESAFSVLIQQGNNKILFDAGYSDAFLWNAEQMQMSLLDLSYIVLSHGHLDHTWGLESLAKHYTEAGYQKIPHTRPTVVTHPSTFKGRIAPDNVQIGCMFSKENLSRFFNVNTSKEPVALNDNWVFLGEIERKFNFEGAPVGANMDGTPDYVEDDSAIVYKTPEGLIVVTGCAHSGICNTIEYAKKVCNDNRVLSVIGGFHLQNPSDEQLQSTLDYFKNANIPTLYPCHCVDLKSKAALAQVANVKEVWVGMSLQF